MAELNLGKGLTAGKVASNVQKKLTRAQEKVRTACRCADVGESDGSGHRAAQRLQRRKKPQPPHRQCRTSTFRHQGMDVAFACEMPASPTSFSMSRSGHFHDGQTRRDRWPKFILQKISIYHGVQAIDMKMSTMLRNYNYNDGERIPSDILNNKYHPSIGASSMHLHVI